MRPAGLGATVGAIVLTALKGVARLPIRKLSSVSARNSRTREAPHRQIDHRSLQPFDGETSLTTRLLTYFLQFADDVTRTCGRPRAQGHLIFSPRLRACEPVTVAKTPQRRWTKFVIAVHHWRLAR